jgi:hypothetical protein
MSSGSWSDGQLREEDGSSGPRAGPAGRAASHGLSFSFLHVSGRGGLAAVGVKRSAPPLTAPRTTTNQHWRSSPHGRPHAMRRDDGRAQRPAGRPLARRMAWVGEESRNTDSHRLRGARPAPGRAGRSPEPGASAPPSERSER